MNAPYNLKCVLQSFHLNAVILICCSIYDKNTNLSYLPGSMIDNHSESEVDIL